jgi:uncharacterized Zn finger protein (UPF0148 family)
MFCPCCGMQLRQSPSNKKDKERIRSKQRRNKILIGKQGKQLQRSKTDRTESITVKIDNHMAKFEN